MQLTAIHLDYIDRFLEQRKVDFLDFKIELKDHFACEIEEIMQTQKLSFEEAFVITSKQWKNELESKKEWIISNERAFPAIIVKSIKTKVLFHYLSVLFLTLIVGFTFSKLVVESFSLFKYIVGFCGVLYFILKRIINQKKVNTSYRFQFEYFQLPVIMIFVYFFVLNLSFPFANFIGLIVIADFPFVIYNFYKHQQFIKKYHLV